jgi:hypothetical protein
MNDDDTAGHHRMLVFIGLSWCSDELKKRIGYIALVFTALAFVNLLFGYLALSMWGLVGEAVGRALRSRLFTALV